MSLFVRRLFEAQSEDEVAHLLTSHGLPTDGQSPVTPPDPSAWKPAGAAAPTQAVQHASVSQIGTGPRTSPLDLPFANPRQAHAAKPDYPIPGPYEIAMAFGAAAVASGRWENVGAAMTAAWFAVPDFYRARDEYLRDLVPAVFSQRQAERPAVGGEEAPQYG